MSQLGYGKGDIVGSPFDFYTGASSIVTSTTISMQNARLVLNPGGAVTLTINLPLNPPDGAIVEVTNIVGSGGTVTATVAAAAGSGDTVVGTAVTGASMTAGTTYRFAYSLNGDLPRSASPRSWIRLL